MDSRSPKKFIQVGGGGIVPQLDAPTSASNAGERRVTIRCQQSSISLPITTDTSPVDILYSAANLMTHNIDPQTSILVESYYTFGLERRLRRYERIRDVINSWDRDSQFALQIVQDESPERSKDLNIENVPRSHDAPQGFVNFPVQHSQKPGRWNKRLLTLLDTGQLYSHKKAGAKLSDKDSMALCVLSDFDVYQITDEDLLRSLKPPKKHSFAIKSQQKNSVFLNTENFIHFFNTDDADVAYNFQHCVHRWRSWYLVNKKVDLGKKEKALHRNGAEAEDAGKSTDIVRSGGHRLRISVDETPYTIGTFQPLMDMDRFDKPIEEFGKDFLPSAPETTDIPVRSKEIPQATPAVRSASNPVQSPTKAPASPPQRIDVFAKDGEFKASGLLGKMYEGRKLQAETRSSDEQPTEGPFTGGLLEKSQQEAALQKQQHQLEQLQRQQEQVRLLNRSNTTVGKTHATVTRSHTTAGGKRSAPIARSNTIVHASNSTPVSRSNTTSGAKNNNTLIGVSNNIMQATNSTPVSTTPVQVSRSNTVATRRSPPTTGTDDSGSRQRSRSRSRTRAGTMTSTSGGTRPTTSDGASYGRQANKPAPLLDMAPAMPEIPSAWREQLGHGVRAPTGSPLISMATDSRVQYRPPGMITSPAMSPPGLARRATTKSSPRIAGHRSATTSAANSSAGSTAGGAAPPTTRRRSQSTAATPERRRYASQEARPPMPLIASAGTGTRHASARRREDDEDVPLINFVDRARGRDLALGGKGLEQRSRSGTLRHI